MTWHVPAFGVTKDDHDFVVAIRGRNFTDWPMACGMRADETPVPNPRRTSQTEKDTDR